MKLADVSIKRPVFATMMILSLVVLGLFALTRLNVDLYPDVDFPYVVVQPYCLALVLNKLNPMLPTG